MKKNLLPPWIEGLERKVLQAYVDGMAPILIQARNGVNANFINNARLRYSIPSQYELRSRGLLPQLKTRSAAPPDPANRVLSRAQLIEKAATEYIAGDGAISLQELVKQYGLASMDISKRVKERGGTVHRGPKKGTAPRITKSAGRNAAIVDAVINQKKTLKEVGDAQDPPISRERVRQICAKAGHKVGFRTEVMKRGHEARRIIHPQEQEIVELLRADRTFPKDIVARYGVTISWLNGLRARHNIPPGNKVNWRTDEEIEREKAAIDAYYNRPDLTSAYISKNILKVNNPAGITQTLKRRGLPRTRGLVKFGPTYKPYDGPRMVYSDAVKRAALLDYQDPAQSVISIAKKHGITAETLYRWRDKAGLPKTIRQHPPGSRTYRPALSSERLEQLDQALRDAVESGKSRSAVARELGVAVKQAIRRAETLKLDFPWAKRGGRTTGGSRPRPDPNYDWSTLDKAITEGHAGGKSMKRIAFETGASFGRVQRRSFALGLVFPSKPIQTLSKEEAAKPKWSRLSDDELKERARNVIIDYMANVPTADIMKKYSIVNSQLYKILDDYGVPRTRMPQGAKGGHGIPTPSEEEKRVLDLYATGTPRKAIFKQAPWLHDSNTKLDSLCYKYKVRRPAGLKRVRRDKGIRRGKRTK